MTQNKKLKDFILKNKYAGRISGEEFEALSSWINKHYISREEHEKILAEKVSRQRSWQRKMREEERCTICGKTPWNKDGHVYRMCKKHVLLTRIYNNNYYARIKQKHK